MDIDPHRLIGWKAIGNFLGRDERTVRRWESERGLPVHRVPGGGSVTVWADRQELGHWLGTVSAHAASATADDAHSRATWLRPGRVALFVFLAIGMAASAAALIAVWPRSQQVAVLPSPVYGADGRANERLLDAQFALNRRNVEGLGEALQNFEALAAQYPDIADAFIGIAETNLLMREFAAVSDDVAYRRAGVAARRAVKIAPDSPAALRALGFVTFWGERRHADGLKLLKRAAALAPGDARTLHWLATTTTALDRPDEGIKLLLRARQIDPQSSAIAADLAYMRYLAGDRATAIAELERLVRIDPAFVGAPRYLTMLYLAEGYDHKYLATAARAAEMTGDGDQVRINAAARAAHGRGGRSAMLDALYDTARADYARQGNGAVWLARIEALRGNAGAAAAWLRRADSAGEPYARMIGGYPEFVPYRNIPEFRAYFSPLNS
jgi:tetratricopeptide (TPR) repeat protein